MCVCVYWKCMLWSGRSFWTGNLRTMAAVWSVRGWRLSPGRPGSACSRHHTFIHISLRRTTSQPSWSQRGRGGFFFGFEVWAESLTAILWDFTSGQKPFWSPVHVSYNSVKWDSECCSRILSLWTASVSFSEDIAMNELDILGFRVVMDLDRKPKTQQSSDMCGDNRAVLQTLHL